MCSNNRKYDNKRTLFYKSSPLYTSVPPTIFRNTNIDFITFSMKYTRSFKYKIKFFIENNNFGLIIKL